MYMQMQRLLLMLIIKNRYAYHNFQIYEIWLIEYGLPNINIQQVSKNLPRNMRDSQMFQQLEFIDSPINSPSPKKIKNKCTCRTCSQNSECIQKYVKLQREFIELENNNRTLNKKFIDKIYNIKYLSKQSIKLAKRVLELQNVIISKSQQIENQAHKIQEIMEQLDQLKRKIVEKDIKILEMQNIISNKELEIAKINEEMKEVTKNKDEQIEVLNTKIQNYYKKYVFIQGSLNNSQLSAQNSIQEKVQNIIKQTPQPVDFLKQRCSYQAQIIQQTEDDKRMTINRRGRYFQTNTQANILQEILRQMDKKNAEMQVQIEKAIEKHMINFIIQENDKMKDENQLQRKKNLEESTEKQKQRLIQEIKRFQLKVCNIQQKNSGKQKIKTYGLFDWKRLSNLFNI